MICTTDLDFAPSQVTNKEYDANENQNLAASNGQSTSPSSPIASCSNHQETQRFSPAPSCSYQSAYENSNYTINCN
ncbi:unnamed protein product [Acanthoscelides obtectus]|uniref:Uncharacterized protein n=1 Tax=Acanthoscelides obtectus TaxID=200917 RepID=A0A9P0JLL5_ACAOB|nr:unnamed protein product [Acanthoscelides obtectus]CAK1678689.1 hypothetical protein AOBTE_LOCUS31999 [Acanthoscelides obtectus]